MAYNGIPQVVIDSTSKVVKRMGNTDMAALPDFDSGTESVVETDFVFDPPLSGYTAEFWTYDDVGDTFNLDSLGCNKVLRKREVNDKTTRLIEQGFTFDSCVFALTKTAIEYWIGIKASSDIITWPMNINKKDGTVYSLAEADLPSFSGQVLSTIQGYEDSGRGLRDDIDACTTQAELDAVVDNRT